MISNTKVIAGIAAISCCVIMAVVKSMDNSDLTHLLSNITDCLLVISTTMIIAQYYLISPMVPVVIWLIPEQLYILVAVLSLLSVCVVKRGPFLRNTDRWFEPRVGVMMIDNLADQIYTYLIVMVWVMPTGYSCVSVARLVMASILAIMLMIRFFTGCTLLLKPSVEQDFRRIMHSSKRVGVPLSFAQERRLSDLYDRVIDCMENKQPFLDGDFTVLDLAGKVYANSNMVSKAIKMFSGVNFNQFVNGYRIDYATNLMKEDHRLKINEISKMAGFNSLPSFNAAFKVKLGQTPSEFNRFIRRHPSSSVEQER